MIRFHILCQHIFQTKNDLTIRATFIVLLSLFVSFSYSLHDSDCKEVFWAVKLDPGGSGDVTLSCKTDAKHLCSESRKVWYGGPGFSLLSLDGFPSANHFKYWPSLGTHGFEIIIRNFSSEDLNQHYICSIGENSCKRNLTINMFHMDVIGDDPNSKISKEDIIVKIAVILGFNFFALFILMFAIIHIYNSRTKKSTSKDSRVSQRSVLENVCNSHNIPDDDKEKLFITPVTYNNDEHKQSENG